MIDLNRQFNQTRDKLENVKRWSNLDCKEDRK